MSGMTETERLHHRLLGTRPTDTLWGWLLPGLVAIIGGILRFSDLTRPNSIVFDETYYVKQAYSLLHWGYERHVNEGLSEPDKLFAAGTPNVFTTTADFVVHPPVGKWVLAVGQQLFGSDNGFGWRFSVALLGTLSILMVGRAARRMFGSTVLGTMAATLLAFDGHHFVHSRTGLLDLILMFFALAAFCALLIDRDHSRAILARKVGALRDAGVDPRDRRLRYGPWLGLHPWRWVAAIALGLAVGTKWSGLYFVAVFCVMTVLWDAGARRAAGATAYFPGALLKDAPPAALTILPMVALTYLVSWTGWFRDSSGGWGRTWAQQHPAEGVASVIPDAVRSLWHYHQEMWNFHVGLRSHHDYAANPWSWLVMGRPTSFYWNDQVTGCGAERCTSAITSIGTITVWWGAVAALVILLFQWALRRDWRAGAILAGLAAGYVPWFQYQDRTIYTFYAVAFVPWVVLAVTYVLGLVLGPPDASPRRVAWGRALAGSYVLLTVLLFIFWWPILTAQVIPFEQWQWRMWFPSWI